MRILIINWRSIKDPLEGGAERATFEFATRWVKNYGAQVFWLSPTYAYNKYSETIDGVHFDYVGLPLNRNIFWLLLVFPIFYVSVAIRYFFKYRGNIDVVIDQVHGIPYLTPLYVKEKKVVYIHEVAGAIWNIMYPLPIKLLGKFCEFLSFYLYKILEVPFIANSPSTFNDLVSTLGFRESLIKIVPYGVTAPKLTIEALPQKEPTLTVIYLNRLVKMKGIERGLSAFSLLLKQFPDAKLWVLGRGEDSYVQILKEQCEKLDISKNVDFIGFKDGLEKYNYLGRAHVLMNPSYLEGWGLVNIEANRMGTPVVAFNVKGCVDSVKEGVSGYLAPDDDLGALVKNIVQIYKKPELIKSSLDYSQQFDWDLQAKAFYEHLEKL